MAGISRPEKVSADIKDRGRSESISPDFKKMSPDFKKKVIDAEPFMPKSDNTGDMSFKSAMETPQKMQIYPFLEELDNGTNENNHKEALEQQSDLNQMRTNASERGPSPSDINTTDIKSGSKRGGKPVDDLLKIFES